MGQPSEPMKRLSMGLSDDPDNLCLGPEMV